MQSGDYKRRMGVFATLVLVLGLIPLVALADNQGQCPEGYTNISSGFSGLSWTADDDYDVVILVGGPPGDENQDPDGRNKTFFDVEAGDVISREAHNISHICVLGSTTTTTEEETTTTTEEETTTTTIGTTTTTIGTTTTTEATTTTTVEECQQPSGCEPPTTTQPDPEVVVPTLLQTEFCEGSDQLLLPQDSATVIYLVDGNTSRARVITHNVPGESRDVVITAVDDRGNVLRTWEFTIDRQENCAEPSTPIAPPTSNVVVTSETLPFTGVSDSLPFAAGSLLALGALILLTSRGRKEEIEGVKDFDL